MLRFGWNATAYQILNPGFELWFSREEDAVAGYVDRAGYRVVGGAPVTSRERLAAVASEFEADATKAGRRICYFAAEARLESLVRRDRRYSMFLLGAQPFWCPASWDLIIRRHASLRAQLNRARNKGVRVEQWEVDRAEASEELHRCLEQWLAGRGLPPLHFLIEPETLERLADRRLFVASRNGEVVGFLVASPIPQRGGWLVEQIVRGRGAVNGTAELMLDRAVRQFASEKAECVTLGLAPLSERAEASPRNPMWLDAILRSLRAHGRRFYNFEGLEAFKAKFEPEMWEPVYAITNERRVTMRALWAIAAAFAQRSPLALLPLAIGQTLRKKFARRR